MPEDVKPKPRPITAKDYTPAGEGRAGSTGVIFGGKSQSKYDTGSMLADIGNLNEVRARNQGFWDAAANTGVNLITTLLGQTVETFGAFLDPIHNWVNETDFKLNEGLSGVGQSIQQYGQEENPIYYDPKKGFNADYVFSHMPSLVSSAAMLIPGWGLGKGAGLVARAARMGAAGERALTIGVGSWGMRHAENRMESAQVYNDIMQQGIQGLDPKWGKLGYEEIEAAAKTGAAVTYTNNWANIIFDAMQLGALMKPIKGLTGWTNTVGKESTFAQVMDYGYKKAVEQGLLKDASRLTKAGLWSANAARPFLQQTTEGFEEAWNDISQKEGMRAAAIAAGVEKDDGSTIFDRIPGYASKWSMWDSFIWGVLGGVTFQAGGTKLNQIGAKAGWWNDTTKQGQMLADLKTTSSILTQGYKDLSNPDYTEYDKAKVKSNILFNLVKGNKSRESLDMLEEDLDNPKLVQHFAKLMNLKQEDTMAEMATIKEDIKFINDQIDYYTGDSKKGWFGQPTTHVGVGIEENQVVTTPGVQPFAKLNPLRKKTGRIEAFVYDPKIAQLLAYNDYSVKVKDRLNAQATVEMMDLQKRAFQGTEIDANGQSLFNVISDIAALKALSVREKEQVADKKSRKLADIFIDAAEARVSKVDDLLEKRVKQLGAIKDTMKANTESGSSDTTFEKAYDHAINTMNAKGDIGKHPYLKSMYYAHLIDKEDAIYTNNRILKDPKKYVADYIDSDSSNSLFEEIQKQEAVRVKQEQEVIDKALASLTSDNNAKYTDAVKKHSNGLTTSLGAYTTDEEKHNYLTSELAGVEADLAKHAADGKFNRKNLDEFTNQFDKETYTDLNARKAALTSALKPYQKVATTTAPAAATTGTSAPVNNGEVPVERQTHVHGSPGQYYKGMILNFGRDGKSGSFHSGYIHGPLGIEKTIDFVDKYSQSTKAIEDALTTYITAKKGNDPNAVSALNGLGQYFHESDYNDGLPEGPMSDSVLQELQYQKAELAEKEAYLTALPLQSKLWTNWVGLSEAQAMKLYAWQNAKTKQGGTAPAFSITTDEVPEAYAPYPEVYKFISAIVGTYPNSEEVFEALPKIEEQIIAELAKAKAAFENKAAATEVVVKEQETEDPNDVEGSISTDEDSSAAVANVVENAGFTPDYYVLPGAFPANAVQLKKNKEGKWSIAYDKQGKQQADPNFDMGHTMYLDSAGKPMNGYIGRGDDMIFRYTGKNAPNTNDTEKEIEILYADGTHATWLDTGTRLTKSIATLEDKISKSKNPEHIREWKGTIFKYHEIIEHYEQLRKGFTYENQTKPYRVADQVVANSLTAESGGVRFGTLITTEKDDGTRTPLDIDSAYGLSEINKPGGPILTTFVNGNMKVYVEKTGKYENVENVHKNMALPTFAKNPKIIQGKGTLNGSIFAMIPTTTLDADGNHIHISTKLFTNNVTHVKMTDNGSSTGKTIPERMLEVITDPDNNSEEFTMLAKTVGITFDNKYKITSDQNRETLLKFYTTDNLIKIFNKVVYVYDASTEKMSRERKKDYRHRVGINVYVPKGKKYNTPVILFDLSFDVDKKNTYNIGLFDDEGNFEPNFGIKMVETAATMPAEEREAAGLKGLAKLPRETKVEVVKRLRNKMIRVDRQLLSRTSEKKAYKAIVFNTDKRLVEQTYDSYLHYLADKQVIESTAHSVNYIARDPKTKKTVQARTFFNNRTYWFKETTTPEKTGDKPTNSNRTQSVPVNEVKVETKPVKVRKTRAKKKKVTTEPATVAPATTAPIEYKDTPTVTTVQEGVEATVTAPGYIKDSAKKHLEKELFKIRQATQFIGTGNGNDSTTQRMENAYKKFDAANTGKYEAGDLIYVSVNGTRGGRVAAVKDGKLNSSYTNVDKAIAAGSSFILDTAAHIANTRKYNVGEVEMEKYLTSKEYVRDDATGVWTPKPTAVAKPVVTAEKEQAPAPTIPVPDPAIVKEIKTLQIEHAAATTELNQLKDILTEMENQPKIKEEVKQVVLQTITVEEVEEIKTELPGTPTTDQVHEQVTTAVTEDLAAGKQAKKRGTVLQRVVNRIKKVMVTLFAAGTLFTGITGFSTNSDGTLEFRLSNTIDKALVVFPQTQQEQAKRLLEKKGLYESKDYQVEVTEDIEDTTPHFTKKNKVEPKLEVLAAVPDSYNPKDSLLVYRSTWNNVDGFNYVPGPNKAQGAGVQVDGVIGVGHFLLDASLYGGTTYSHPNNQAFLATAKANNDYVPAFRRLPDGKVNVKYKRYADLDSADIVPAPLRQFKVSDINWLSQGAAKGFKSGVHEVKTTSGKGTYLIFKDRKGYSRFSGGSVVFIFEKDGNEIVVDYAGSLEMIQKEAGRISQDYGVPADSLILGYHDVGSFSAKPKAKNGVISSTQYAGYNNEGFTGGALLIPMPDEAPAKTPKLPAGITSLSVLLATIKRKRKNNEPITDDDLNDLRERIAALTERINQINNRVDYLNRSLPNPTGEPTADLPEFPIHPAIQKSMDDTDSNKIRKVGTGAGSYYKIYGTRHERQSHVLNPPKEGKSDALDAGTMFDSSYKAVWNGGVPNPEHFTYEAGQKLVDAVNMQKQFLASRGQQTVGTDVIVHAKGIIGDDQEVRNIAGEIDIMAGDQAGQVFIYDVKTSNFPFDLDSYHAPNKVTNVSPHDMNREQLSGYSALNSHMTDKEAAGIGIFPNTINYTRVNGKLIIDNVIPYPTIMFESIKRIPLIPPKTDGKGSLPSYSDVTGEVSKKASDNMMFNEDLDEPAEQWMDDLNQPSSTIPAMIDIEKFRDRSIDYHKQKEFEDYTVHMMLDFLYEDKVENGDDHNVNYHELLEGAKGVLDEQILNYQRIIRDANDPTKGGPVVNGTRIRLTSDQVAVKRAQLDHLLTLQDGMDTSDDFIGYGKLGLMTLSAMGIIKINIDMETVSITGPEDQPTSVRYLENFSVKINPKTTIQAQAKIFLTRIREMTRSVDKDDNLEFNFVPNVFGIKKYFNLDTILDTLYIQFEDVAPERFMDKLDELNNNNPIVHSIVRTLGDIFKEDSDRSAQIRLQLTDLMKQRRDMKFMKIESNEDGSVKDARVIDAARLGVKHNIFKEWENMFRAKFDTLYNITEHDDDLRSTSHTVVPKALEINYTAKGKSYDTAVFTVPDSFRKNKAMKEQDLDWMYKELKAIATGNVKKRLDLTFNDKSELVVDGYRTGISKNDMAVLILSFPADNFVLNHDMQEIFKGHSNVSNTIMDQIVQNIDYFSKPSLRGVTIDQPGAPKDPYGYPTVYYKIVADQLDRIGIRLAEDPSVSWTVLQDINGPLNLDGSKRKFHIYDREATNFNTFMVDKVDNLIVKPLLEPGVFTVGQQEYLDEDGGDYMETQKTLSVELPFSHSLQGLEPFARHARSEWYSYINATIRNSKGDREYTYTDPNGLSTLMAKLKDSNNGSGLLHQVGATPLGRYNVFVQNLLGSPDALNGFNLHYFDAGKIDNYTLVEPDSLNAARSQLILWNMFYHNENKTVERNKAGYITTHSDSSIMPIFTTDKLKIYVDFMEYVDEETGNRSYTVSLPKELPNGSDNPAYNHLYGMFRGELQRIQETFNIYQDILNHSEDETERVNYAFRTYKAGINFSFKGGKLAPGYGANLYLFGNQLYEGNKSGIYLNSAKSQLDTNLFDKRGNPNETEIEKHFYNAILQPYINSLINDAEQDLVKLGDGFFKIKNKTELGSSSKDTKTLRRTLSTTLLDTRAAGVMKKTFENNSLVINNGKVESVTTRDIKIEKDYKEDDFKNQFEDPEDRKTAVQLMKQKQDEDAKAATYPELFQRYLVADMAINNAIFFGSLFTLMGDPASYEAGNNYQQWKDQHDKRMKWGVSPGKTRYYKEGDDVHVIGFEDVKIGDFKMDVDRTTLTPLQKEFIEEYDKQIGAVNGRYPVRLWDQMVFFYRTPMNERKDAWKTIEKILDTKMTDGGSYMSTKEYLYRAQAVGKISKDQYWDTVEALYSEKRDPDKIALAHKIVKYVYGGSTITTVGDNKTNQVSYVKHGETTLIPKLFEDSVLDEIRKQLDEVETKLYEGRTNGEPTPGVMLVPRSSFKTGFPSNTRLVDENGNVTQELLTSKVHKLDRSNLREQIQSPDEKDYRATVTTQGNVLLQLDQAANERYGQRGRQTFSRIQGVAANEESEVVYDDNGKEVVIEESGTGISANVMETASVNVFTQMARMKMIDKMFELGLGPKDTRIIITSIDQFLAKMKVQAVNQFGIGSITAAFLNTINEGDKNILPIPISFTSAGKRIQSVLLAEFKEIFYRFTLPGSAFTQYSSFGVYKKGDITPDSQLKYYRMKINTSKKYESAADANRDFAPEEIHKPWDPVSQTVDYFSFEPAEIIIPWPFKNAKGDYLNFDKYCLPDGTPRNNIDENLLYIPSFRIPNTGANSSGPMKIAKFTRPGTIDGIAAAPEFVAVISADFDFDKLYTYTYNHKIGKDGKLEKVESILHHTQDGVDINSNDYKRQYAKNQLMHSAAYRSLKYKLKQARATQIDLDEDYNDAAENTGKGIMGLLQTAGIVTEDNSVDAVEKELTAMEDNFMNAPEFDTAFANANIYERQSMAALENAVIDRFNIVLGDYKMLKHLTTPLTTDWLQEQLDKKVVPVSTIAGGIEYKSMQDVLTENKFHAITSYNSFNNSRLANSSASDVISMGANAVVGVKQGQRWNLFLNTVGIDKDYVHAFLPRFYDKSGELKSEETATPENSTYAGRYNPYVLKTKTRKKLLYNHPDEGRYRLDRLAVEDDAGKKIFTSHVVRSTVQAALDHQNNPLIDKLNVNPTTFNAFNAAAALGFVDEIFPLLQQEAVVEYSQGVSNYFSIWDKAKRAKVLIDTVSKYASAYGYDRTKVSTLYYSLPDFYKNAPVLIQSIMDVIDPLRSVKLKTSDLHGDVAKRVGKSPIDNDYNLRQLEALRNYGVFDNIGRQLFTVKNNTSAYSRGLKTSFPTMHMQELGWKQLFKYFKNNATISSSAPLIGGLHRISYGWASAVGRPKEHKKSMAEYGNYSGLVPSMNMLRSIQGSIFTEFTPLFEEVRRLAFKTGMGINPLTSLQGLSSKDYEHVFHKVNTNLVAFMFSNPALYAGIVTDPEEYSLLEEWGLELMKRPHNDIEYKPEYRYFNKAESLAKELTVIAKKKNPTTGRPYIAEYDILAALRARLQTSYKTPSSVTYDSNFAYQENVNRRLAISLADMYYSPLPEVNTFARKLILYAFMSGGITTPHSFVQYIAPNLLYDIGLDKIIRNMISTYNEKRHINGIAKTFMVQYYQHFPFELKGELDEETDFQKIDGEYEQKDPKTGESYYVIHPDRKAWFKGKFVFRLDNRIFVKDSTNKNLVMLDNLGMSRYNSTEYMFNDRGENAYSLYSSNITDASRIRKEGIELGGEISDEEIILDEVQEYQIRRRQPIYEKLLEKPTDLNKVIKDIEIDGSNPMAAAVLDHLLPVLQDMELSIAYTNIDELKAGMYDIDDPKKININLQYKDFKGLNTGDPDTFSTAKYVETLAHEAAHAVTAETIKNVMLGDEKDPDKVRAVERLRVLVKTSIKALEADKTLAKGNKLLLLRNKLAEIQPKESALAAEIRLIQEFVARTLTNAEFQISLNKIILKDNKKSLLQEIFDLILGILGLNISSDEATNEIKYIQKKLTASEPYVVGEGTMDRRASPTGLSQPLKDMQNFTALHVALREILTLTKSVQATYDSMLAAKSIGKAMARVSNSKLYMTDLYEDVSNFDPTWSQEIMEQYNNATLNRKIIC